jgi:hypothetical protein
MKRLTALGVTGLLTLAAAPDALAGQLLRIDCVELGRRAVAGAGRAS